MQKPYRERVILGEDEIEVEFYFYPASRGLRERSGLQLEPDEPASIEIESITDLEGYSIEVDKNQEQEIIAQLFELRAEREYESKFCDQD